MDHTEAIIQINNVVNKSLCDKVIKIIDQKAKKQMQVLNFGKNELDKKVRNVLGYNLQIKDRDIFNKINNEIQRLYIFYKIKFPKMYSSRINQIDLLKYEVGGKYELHIDHGTVTNRHLSIIMNLNNDYEGGDLIFTDQKHNEIKRLKLGKGSIVFFPSNFMYPHGIKPITKGTRYSIVAWLQ